jgi:hypothetical protein
MPRSVDELPKAEVWTLLKDDRFWLPNQEGCGAKVVLTRRVVVRFAFNRGTGEVGAPPGFGTHKYLGFI